MDESRSKRNISSTGGTQGGGASARSEAFLLLAVLFVGNDFVAVKYALEGIPPLVLMPLRFVLAGLVLVGVVGIIERRSPLKWRDLLPVAGVGVVGITLNHIGYTVGLSLTSGSDAALIFATAPVWGMVLGILLRAERGSLRGALGLGLALVGVGLVVYQGLGSPKASLAGNLLVCVSAFSWGAYAVLSLPLLKRYTPLALAAYTMLLGGAAAIPFALTGVPGISDSVFVVDWSAVGVRSWAGAAYSTLLASAFAIAAWQGSVARMGANKVLVYLYLVTLVGVTSSVLLLDEGLGAAKIAGAAVILFGVYVVRRG